MYSALLAKRRDLHQDFEKKLARFKEILIKEMVREGEHQASGQEEGPDHHSIDI